MSRDTTTTATLRVQPDDALGPASRAGGAESGPSRCAAVTQPDVVDASASAPARARTLGIAPWLSGVISPLAPARSASIARAEAHAPGSYDERFRRMFAASPVGVELYDEAGRLLEVNAACLELFGVVDPNTLRGFCLFDDPNLSEEATERLRHGESVRDVGAFDFERVKALSLYDTTKAGVIFIDVVLTPVDAPTGGYLVQVRDVTEHHRNVDSLQAANARLELHARERAAERTGVDAAQRSVVTRNLADAGRARSHFAASLGALRRRLEAQTFLAEAGSALAESLDWDATVARIAALAVPFLGESCSLDVVEGGEVRSLACANADAPVFGVSPERRPRQLSLDLLAEHPVVTATRTGAPVRANPGPAEGGRVAASLVVPLVANGRSVGALTLTRVGPGGAFGQDDVTLVEAFARRAALALEAARVHREAREATSHREELLAVVAHELKNPLSVVLLSCQSYARTPARAPEETRTQLLGRIENAARRGTRIVGDLLDLASFQSGKPRVERRLERATTLVQEALAELAASAQAKEISIVAAVSPDLPPVWCDRGRLLQVLTNLMLNAIHVTPRGGRVEAAAEQRDGELVFAVRDRGPGVCDHQLPGLFDPFWRSRDLTCLGAGLGLAISRLLVEAHDGRIWAESERGVGSSYMFALPLGIA